MTISCCHDASSMSVIGVEFAMWKLPVRKGLESIQLWHDNFSSISRSEFKVLDPDPRDLPVGQSSGKSPLAPTIFCISPFRPVCKPTADLMFGTVSPIK